MVSLLPALRSMPVIGFFLSDLESEPRFPRGPCIRIQGVTGALVSHVGQQSRFLRKCGAGLSCRGCEETTAVRDGPKQAFVFMTTPRLARHPFSPVSSLAGQCGRPALRGGQCQLRRARPPCPEPHMQLPVPPAKRCRGFAQPCCSWSLCQNITGPNDVTEISEEIHLATIKMGRKHFLT